MLPAGEFADIEDIPRNSMDTFLNELYESTPSIVKFIMFKYTRWNNSYQVPHALDYWAHYRQSEVPLAKYTEQCLEL